MTRLARSLRRDDGVSEVVSYSLMFALGAAALVLSMDLFVDTQEHGARIASAQQADRLAQVTGTTVGDAATVAHAAPNATFESTVDLPDAFRNRNFTIQLFVPCEPDPDTSPSDWDDFWNVESGGWSSPSGCPANDECPVNAEVHVATSEEDIDATARLGNRTTAQVQATNCLVLDTQVSITESAGSFDVTYELAGGTPTITLAANDR